MESIVDATYVINMDSDSERLKDFDSMMTSCNWKYTRQPAINGKKLIGMSWNNINNGDDYENLKDQLIMMKKYVKHKAWLKPSEIGCLLSHVYLWEDVANDPSKKRIAIFEDDARTHLTGDNVSELIMGLYTYMSENNINEPDILYLGKSLDACLSYKKVWNNVYINHHPLCLHAYIITKQGAQKLLRLAPYMFPIDVIPIKAIERNKIVSMTFHPSLYFQDVFNNVSNLRQLGEAINNTTECLIDQQHISGYTWQFIFVIAVGIVAALVLFIIFFFSFSQRTNQHNIN